MNFERVPAKEVMTKCAWCGKTVEEEQSVYTISAKIRKELDIDLSDYEGEGVYLNLPSVSRKISAIVPTADSEASKEGYDLLIMACSEKCTSELQEAVSSAIKIGDRLFNDPDMYSEAEFWHKKSKEELMDFNTQELLMGLNLILDFGYPEMGEDGQPIWDDVEKSTWTEEDEKTANEIKEILKKRLDEDQVPGEIYDEVKNRIWFLEDGLV